MRINRSQKKYKVFLSSTLADCSSLRTIIINQLIDAGFFVSAMEFMIINIQKLNQLRDEIDNCDIFILLVKETIGSAKIYGIPAIEYEYDCALDLNKPILAYFSDNGNYGDFSDNSETKIFKKKVINAIKYRKLIFDNEGNMHHIFSDLINLINSELIKTYWIKSDISKEQLISIDLQKNRLLINLFNIKNSINCFRDNYENDKSTFYELVGPLIDISVFKSNSGQAHKYTKKVNPGIEQLRDQLTFEYYFDRFTKLNDGDIYDSKLKLRWKIKDNGNYLWQEANSLSTEEWRIPTIDELATLLTANKYGNYFIESSIFNTEKQCFWSSSIDDENKKAYYIDTLFCAILKDAITTDRDHKKAVILCKEDSRYSNPIPTSVRNGLTEDTEIREIDLSNNIYSIYFSEKGCRILPNKIDKIRATLLSYNFYTATHDSVCLRYNSLQNEFYKYDYYILIYDHESEANPSIMNRVSRELDIAKEIGLNIILIYDKVFNMNKEQTINELGLNNYDDVEIYPIDMQKIETEIHPRLINSNKKMGWIKNNHYEMINSYFIQKNNIALKHFSYKNEICNMIAEFNEKSPDSTKQLKSFFEEIGILIEKPTFGTCTRFVDIKNPVSRFLYDTTDTEINDFPILFVDINSRFKLNENNDAIAKDNHLKKQWLRVAKKRCTFDEAKKYAQECITEKHNWRLPSISELMTLLTIGRGERKFMDEIVFPDGRWYWSSTVSDDMIFFLDFNTFYQSIGKEKTTLAQNESYHKKAVLLITDEY